jgi:hypothetical protein
MGLRKVVLMVVKTVEMTVAKMVDLMDLLDLMMEQMMGGYLVLT